jgi:hypothetical protein
MRRFQLPAAIALVHAIATVAAITLTIADAGRSFPRSPSLLGRLLGGVAYLLGFPVVSGAMFMESSPFFGPVWQGYALLAANSALWGLAAAFLLRRACGARVVESTGPTPG